MASLLGVRDERRSRSKSPGGRDRDRSRSHSRDTRGDGDRRDRDRDRSSDRRRSSRYDDDDDEDLEDDRSYSKKKSSSYYDEDEDDSRRRSKGSKKYDEDTSEDDRYRSSKPGRDSSRREYEPSNDDRRREDSKKDRPSESDSDRRRSNRQSRQDISGRGDPSYGYPPGSGYAPPEAPAPPGSYQEVRPRDSRHMSYVGSDPRYAPPGGYDGSSAPPRHERQQSYSGPKGVEYAQVEPWKYARPEQNVDYKYNDGAAVSGQQQYASFRPEYDRSRPSASERDRNGDRKEKKSSDERCETREPRNKKYYDDDKYSQRDKKYREDKYGSSPDDVTKKMSKMAVAGGGLGAATLGVGMATQGFQDGGRPPASPLLEAYKGTYQSISPMPGALVLANHKDDSDLSDFDLDHEDEDDAIQRKIRKLEREKAEFERSRGKAGDRNSSGGGYEVREPRDRNSDRGGLETREPRSRRLSNLQLDTNAEARPPGSILRDRSPNRMSTTGVFSPITPNGKKTVSFYDPRDDAKRIARALQGNGPADPRPLVTILPPLSTDDLLALRAEYKNFAKVSGQGINIAKHIKMRIPGNLGKACYATALGRWESEAYWANSWYQGGASRRELLIESLMGRSNHDIKEIKNCFKDKKYGDDLERCIRAELKADKFRMAILLVLEERRMPESNPVDIRLVKDDVYELDRVLRGQGGESEMIKIIVMRSDVHLREMMRMFERTYETNFARAMISKSRNLVGETLAHILNGALNRPMRDALLLRQAISETAPGKERTELLISRLVRLHWEPKHLERVKKIYYERYNITVREAIKREVGAYMKTAEGKMCSDFCVELVDSSA
ncbi:hypothetical protein PV10_08776 [Exophiala mesophila]|uniref:Annexin n=1 Tax=Exophiala mesophila TaxID=212818 RepID=A0A0D1ZQX8_EXOME|nr:uncharacterized protein PV10_08776 [Exophiala mesophila]KIV89188.1 hypothetical protein PV10_08776 [Exophiala mesophila]